jgi:hypothetical protein
MISDLIRSAPLLHHPFIVRVCMFAFAFVNIQLLEKLVTLASSPSASDRTTSLFAFIREHQKEREEEQRQQQQQQQGGPAAGAGGSSGTGNGGVKVDGIVAEG